MRRQCTNNPNGTLTHTLTKQRQTNVEHLQAINSPDTHKLFNVCSIGARYYVHWLISFCEWTLIASSSLMLVHRVFVCVRMLYAPFDVFESNIFHLNLSVCPIPKFFAAHSMYLTSIAFASSIFLSVFLSVFCLSPLRILNAKWNSNNYMPWCVTNVIRFSV